MLAAPLLDHLIGSGEDRRRDGQPEGFGGLEVDDELELGRLLDRQIGGLGTLENLVHVNGSAPVEVKNVRAIRHEATGVDMELQGEHRRQVAPCREPCNLLSLGGTSECWVQQNDESAGTLFCDRREGAVDLAGTTRLEVLKPHPQSLGRNLRVAQLWCATWIGRIREDGHA